MVNLLRIRRDHITCNLPDKREDAVVVFNRLRGIVRCVRILPVLGKITLLHRRNAAHFRMRQIKLETFVIVIEIHVARNYFLFLL